MIHKESTVPRNTYNPGLIESLAAVTPWIYNMQTSVKAEPMEEDSGVHSGSDCQSSSPTRESNDYNHQPSQFPYTVYPHNPLTPPNSEPLVSPRDQSTLTPCNSPQSQDEQDHIRKLEMTMQNPNFFTPKTEYEASDNEEVEELNWSLPKLNSHGKPKLHRCKQCDFVADTKGKHWSHLGSHIPEQKRLQCQRCPFVTEYKHHLEYHIRLHAGTKPFQCKKCEYSCVNKSMLNSHMKSHSNVYRYSCSECSYATKYCHSLKMHLRRYKHKPNVVLDEQGRPCPEQIIDVYGTRRGPKIKTPITPQPVENSPRMDLPFPLQFPFPPYPLVGLNLQNAQLLHQLVQERMSQPQEPVPEPVKEEPGALDLSRSTVPELRNRRKGPAFRIDPNQTQQTSDEEDEDAETSTTVFDNVEVVENPPVENAPSTSSDTNNNPYAYNCPYCSISFKDLVLHTIHMGYHGYNNPLTCNMCGVECVDKVDFFVHMNRASH